ncbi:MAG: hypothetical protein A2Z30_04375 [Chloroflexi bacterium RBG_16_64_43]|nr:MAG: hypothetical protein A2Z30_04375 [Chloroflexi bacterium RBG_16_64_43]
MSLFTVMGGALLGMPSSLVSAREAGIFRTYKINGVPALSILVIPVLTSMLHALLATLVIALTAPALFDGRAPANWVGFLLVFLASAFAFAGIGTLIGVVSSDARITVLYSQLVFLPSMILGGLMLPSSILPPTMAKLGLLLPTTYAMDAFGGLAMGQADGMHPWLSLAILAAGGLLALAMSVFLFSWDSKNTTRRGHPALALLAWAPYLVGLLLSL